MSELFQKDDIGARFTAVFTSDGSALDISTATTKEIILRKPDGDVLTKTASFTNSGSDGSIYYVTQSGDLDQAGLWRLQGHVIMGTNNWRSESQDFRVYPNLD